MMRSMRRALFLVGLVALVLGVACLNYTVHGKADEHREWASEHGLPAPSHELFYVGLVCTAGGAAFVGFAAGRRGKK